MFGSSFNEHDERKNKNLYCSYEEIDNRQAVELGAFVSRWQEGKVEPWDALLHTSFIVGARPSFLASYDISRKYAPGTRGFERELGNERSRISDRARDIGKDSMRQLTHTKEWLERRARENAKDTQGSVEKYQKEEMQKAIAGARPGLLPIDQDGRDEEGPGGYKTALEELYRLRAQAGGGNDGAAKAIVEHAITRVRVNKLDAEYDAAHVDEALERFTKNKLAEHQSKIDALKALIRPEVLAMNEEAVENIKVVTRHIEEGTFDSWQAAAAIADIILDPDAKLPKMGPWNKDEFPQALFKEEIEKERQACAARKKDVDKTISRFMPDTEDSIRQELAQAFEEAARKNRAAPPSLPAEKICKGLYIEPMGTGLIEPYKHSEYWEQHDAELYGTSLARITTYRLSFEPDTPENTQLLRRAVIDGLKALAEVPYGYHIPTTMMCGDKGEPYRRMETRGYYVSPDWEPYVDIENGKAVPGRRLDLDDLWRLYYILEPIIAPSAQVAAALNAARYAEERGAILDPDNSEFFCEDHKVGNTSGAFGEVKNGKVLETVLRDTFIDYALDDIDEAELLVRLTSLSDMTLRGRLFDAGGTLQTYAQLEDGKPRGEITPYTEMLHARVKDLVVMLAGKPDDKDEAIGDTLMRMKMSVETTLKDRFRQKSRTDAINAWEQMNAAFARQMSKDWNITDILDKYPDDDDIEEELKKAPPPKDLHARTQLVVADSGVEPQIDGIHAGGRYKTRTKDSLFVRKELPEALKPFDTGTRPGMGPALLPPWSKKKP